jgi:macrodomain Ter protein organizer (MatP/YcbG family)
MDKKIKIEKIEDIYPLTIVKMRFGGKIVIFNADSDAGFVDSVQGDEEVYYVINEWLEKHVSPCLYGIGDTIYEAFENYKKRYYNY